MYKTITLEEFKKLLKKTKNLYIDDKRWVISNEKEKGDFLFIESHGYGINFRDSENETIKYYTQKNSRSEHTVFLLKSQYDGLIGLILYIPILLE